jgi:class 3 adenylate cyclase
MGGDNPVLSAQTRFLTTDYAVEIQRDVERRNAKLQEARRMRFRIGVNLGDVMIEGDELSGDGVTVATRMEAMAEPVADGAARDAGQGRRRRRERCTDAFSR